MAHTPKNYDQLIAECAGFLSENQLKAHFTLYQGYVKKLNEIEERLAKADPTTANYSFSEYSELRRREPSCTSCTSKDWALPARVRRTTSSK